MFDSAMPSPSEYGVANYGRLLHLHRKSIYIGRYQTILQIHFVSDECSRVSSVAHRNQAVAPRVLTAVVDNYHPFVVLRDIFTHWSSRLKGEPACAYQRFTARRCAAQDGKSFSSTTSSL
jgi:hypothetical protein